MTAEPTYRLEGVVKAKADELQDFVGPLDVILLLLSKNKIEIKDIRISLILEQYLWYLDDMKRMDLEIASEFIAMASYLLYIKTKTLLAVGSEEADSEMEQFIKSLEERQRQEEYAKVRSVMDKLAAGYESGKNYITRPQEPLSPDKAYKYEHTGADLTDALKNIIVRTEQRLPPPVSNFEGVVGREPFPVTEKTADIIRRLIKNGVMRFTALFKGSRSRSEIVATFISVLELCRGSKISLAGGDEDCTVSYIGDEGGENIA